MMRALAWQPPPACNLQASTLVFTATGICGDPQATAAGISRHPPAHRPAIGSSGRARREMSRQALTVGACFHETPVDPDLRQTWSILGAGLLWNGSGRWCFHENLPDPDPWQTWSILRAELLWRGSGCGGVLSTVSF